MSTENVYQLGRLSKTILIIDNQLADETTANKMKFSWRKNIYILLVRCEKETFYGSCKWPLWKITAPFNVQ